MAAHPSITLGDLSGAWQLNRSLSDNTEELLKLQGLSSPIRKILNYANVTLQISQYTGEDNNTHIDITQSAGAGVASSVETRTLDWTERKQKNGIWGSVGHFFLLEVYSFWSCLFQEEMTDANLLC